MSKSNSGHTPGPWSVANWRETDKADRLIATVAIVGDCVVGPKFDSPYMTNYESHGSDVADANLIAAAPDLLLALRALLNDTQHAEHSCTDPECPVALARAAIAKSEGKS